MRRYKLLKVSSELLLALLKQDGKLPLQIDGIPSDMRFNAAWYDHEHDYYIFRVESETFLDTAPHESLTDLTVTVRDVESPARILLGRILFDKKVDEYILKEIAAYLEAKETSPRLGLAE